MKEAFRQFVREHKLFTSQDPVLVGVSGGIDSVVMLDLLVKNGFRCGIVHCNFQLRGDEADLDEQFVGELAEQYEIPLYTRKFDTKGWAGEQNISIQMAARRLRFDWFEKIRREKGYSYVAIGHNKEDVLETFLINLSRGTGLKGITGIKPKSENIVRPLLFASRGEIESYALERSLIYREDSSNQTTKYTRNRIRHNILPEFQRINPRFLDTMMENIERFRRAWSLYDLKINQVKESLLLRKGKEFHISIKGLQEYPETLTILYELLRPMHFSQEVVEDLLHSLEHESGRTFYSRSHKLVKDRSKLIIIPLEDETSQKYYIDKGQHLVMDPVEMEIEVFSVTRDFRPSKEQHIACLDLDLLEFPLILRKWNAGDYFKPLGFGHYKKLSDFFIDRKYSLIDKEETWLLTSGEKIVWILGDRLDDRFKITDQTKNVLKITLKPHH